MDHLLNGLYVPLITPFDADGKVAAAALESLAYDVLDSGAAGLVALGTTAEASTLDPAERDLVLEVCARVCRERSAQLIAGAGTNDTLGSGVALRRLADRPEVSAALVVVPYFTRPSEEGVVAHFEHLAADSPVPIVVYNVSYRTGRVLSAETLLRLAALPGVVGVKHAVGSIDEDTVELLAGCPGDFAVLAGDDVFASPMLALGAAGGILASAHLNTRHVADMFGHWRDGRNSQARELGHHHSRLARALFAEPNPVVIKAVLHAQGRIPAPDVRLPLLPASPATVATTLRILE